MTPSLLFRPDAGNRDELGAARRHFPGAVRTLRTECEGELVVGRYAVLPYYDELAADLAARGSRLVNSPGQHRWVARFEYYDALREFTPRSWDERAFPRSGFPGPFVVKGRTNSRKQQWATRMYAADRREAVELGCRLMEDPLIAEQGLVYREYVPLATYEVGLNGLPFADEWRCFFLGEELLAAGYYWSQAEDAESRVMAPAGLALARRAAAVAARHVEFFVLDVARTAAGPWILIEVNDGQQSGPCMCDPDELYGNLARALARRSDA